MDVKHENNEIAHKNNIEQCAQYLSLLYTYNGLDDRDDHMSQR